MKKRKVTTLTFYDHGERIRKKVSYHTAAELADKKTRLERDIYRRSHAPLSDIAESWKDQHFKTIQHYTAESYTAPYNDIISEFGDLEVSEITPQMIQNYLNRLHAQGYAQQTIKLRKIVLSQIIDHAIFTGFAQFNPTKVCKIPKAAKTSWQPPPPEEIEKIRNAPESLWKNYFLLLMYTGLRREEALALTKADLDFDNCTIRVNKAIIFQHGAPIARNFPKSAAGDRFAPFPTYLHRFFENAPNGLIFANNGKPIHKSQFDKSTAKFRRDLGITCTSHQLRHYFATVCHGVIDAKDAQHLLGHSKVSTTLDIYTNLDRMQKAAAIQKINEYIDTLTTT